MTWLFGLFILTLLRSHPGLGAPQPTNLASTAADSSNSTTKNTTFIESHNSLLKWLDFFNAYTKTTEKPPVTIIEAVSGSTPTDSKRGAQSALNTNDNQLEDPEPPKKTPSPALPKAPTPTPNFKPSTPTFKPTLQDQGLPKDPSFASGPEPSWPNPQAPRFPNGPTPQFSNEQPFMNGPGPIFNGGLGQQGPVNPPPFFGGPTPQFQPFSPSPYAQFFDLSPWGYPSPPFQPEGPSALSEINALGNANNCDEKTLTTMIGQQTGSLPELRTLPGSRCYVDNIFQSGKCVESSCTQVRLCRSNNFNIVGKCGAAKLCCMSPSTP